MVMFWLTDYVQPGFSYLIERSFAVEVLPNAVDARWR